MDTQKMKDIIRIADEAVPVAELNGKKVVTFEDYTALATANAINGGDLGLVKMNPDGTPAATPVKYVAANMENFFINRYRQVRKTLQVVTDYRCIKAQASGKIPYKQVPCFIISRGEDGNLQLDKQITITDNEFLSDFRHSLDREAMLEILPLLEDTGITKDKLAI